MYFGKTLTYQNSIYDRVKGSVMLGNAFYPPILNVAPFWLTENLNINLLKPTGYMMHQQFYIQQLYALPTLYLCVLYLSENRQRLVPLTA